MPNNNKILEEVRFSTTRLIVTKSTGSQSIGTGFFFYLYVNPSEADGKVYPLLVTNKHMIDEWSIVTFNLTVQNEDGSPNYGTVETFTINKSEYDKWLTHPDSDLAVLPIKAILDKSTRKVFYRALSENLIPKHDSMSRISSIENIIMVGYPDGMYDSVNNLPIVRRGITATDFKIDYEGRKEFLIDASIFKGSSGSPILICDIGSYNNENGELCLGNRVVFLGIQYRGEFSAFKNNIFVKDPSGQYVNAKPIISMNFNDLGFCVKSECLEYFRGELSK